MLTVLTQAPRLVSGYGGRALNTPDEGAAYPDLEGSAGVCASDLVIVASTGTSDRAIGHAVPNYSNKSGSAAPFQAT